MKSPTVKFWFIADNFTQYALEGPEEAINQLDIMVQKFRALQLKEKFLQNKSDELAVHDYDLVKSVTAKERRLCAQVTHRFFCPTVTEEDINEAFNKILGA